MVYQHKTRRKESTGTKRQVTKRKSALLLFYELLLRAIYIMVHSLLMSTANLSIIRISCSCAHVRRFQKLLAQLDSAKCKMLFLILSDVSCLSAVASRLYLKQILHCLRQRQEQAVKSPRVLFIKAFLSPFRTSQSNLFKPPLRRSRNYLWIFNLINYYQK